MEKYLRYANLAEFIDLMSYKFVLHFLQEGQVHNSTTSKEDFLKVDEHIVKNIHGQDMIHVAVKIAFKQAHDRRDISRVRINDSYKNF